MPGYSSAFLKRIRRVCPNRAMLSPTVFRTIQTLGIVKPFRGTRSGFLNNRRIPVVVRRNSTLDQRPRPCMVNTSNLTDVGHCLDLDVFKILPSVSVSRGTHADRSLSKHAKDNVITIAKCLEIPKVSVCVMNCRSVKNKSAYLSDFILANDFDCVAMTETWLSSNEQDNNTVLSALVPSSYRLLHVARHGAKGGGVAFMCKKQYSIKMDASFKASSFESMSVLLDAGSFTFHFAVIYRVPPSK